MPAASSGLAARPEPLTAAPAPSTPAPAATVRTRPGGAPATTTRSWYLHTATADDLANAATAIYHDLRGTLDKATILDALIRGGLDHLPAVRRGLGLDD